MVNRGDGNPQFTSVLAVVDSGADRSFFPKEVATELGITDEELTEDEGGGRGVEDEGFPTWSSTVPIIGSILAYIDGADEPQMWGNPFPLNPAFSEKEATLLGRQDFFKVFTITFENEANGPVHHLDYDEPNA